MSKDTRRYFYWSNIPAFRYLIQKNLALKSRSSKRVYLRSSLALGDYILKDGNIKYTIVDPGGNGYHVYSDNLKEIRFALRKAEKYITSQHEVREVIKPILPQITYDNIQEWVFDFYKAIEELKTTKGFGNVGIILLGPAGVGKSETMRWLREIAYQTYGRKNWQISMADLSRMLENAEPLNADSPLILIDDIDANILRHREETRNPMTSQFLTCLDGLDKREGRVMILSTNEKVDNIDPALLRPGRFEHVIYFTYPKYELIVQFCNERSITVDPSKLEGWSFAKIDMLHAKWRIANHLYGTSQEVYYEKFIYLHGETDSTVEAYEKVSYK